MPLKRKVRRQAKHSEGSWAVSYVDMLTLLLCFFIIFYNDSQKSGEENILNKIAFDLSGKPSEQGSAGTGGVGSGGTGGSFSGLSAAAAKSTGKAGAGNGPGYGPGNGTGNATGEGSLVGSNLWGKATIKGTGNTTVSHEDLALLELIKARIKEQLPANLKSGERSLEINFEGISFFESGKTTVLPEAQEQVYKVIELLGKYKDIVKVTVQGHTDPTKTSKHRTFSDNWELSALRATSVLKLFIKAGYSQERLSAEGFADSKAAREIASEQLSKEEMAKLRKITLRVEPVQVK